jgi:NNP family nitrate/nitrite transporter-like MFS transporter
LNAISALQTQEVNPLIPNMDSPTFSSQWGPLLFLTAIFFLNFLARIILSPLLPMIVKDLGVSHTEAGSLFLLISLGYFSTLLGSGYFSSRLNHKRTIILSATVVGMTVLGISLSSGLWGIRMGLLLLGMAAGLYLPSGIATLTSLVNPKHWGKAIAIHELAPNLGFVVAPLVSEALLIWFSWRTVLVLLGGISILAGMAFARFGKGGEFPGEAPGLRAFKTLRNEPAFWIMMVLFSLGIAGTLGVYTMLPLYLVTEQGINRSWANALIALSRVSGLGMALLAGWVSDRLGRTRTMRSVFLLTGLATILLGVLPGSWVIFMIFLQPVIAVCFFPPGFSVLSSIGPPSLRNVAVSLTIPVAFIVGGGAIPALIGYMGDTASFASGITLVGVLILMGVMLSPYLKQRDG